MSRGFAARVTGRVPLPDPVRAVALEPGERRLAWAVTEDGAAVVATDERLHLPGGAAMPWWQVAKVVWERPALTVTQVAAVEGHGAVVQVRVAQEHGGLPDVLRTRVTASIAWSSRARLGGGGAVRVVGRRRPDREALEWQLVFDRDEDVADPAVRAEAEQLLDAARRTIG